MSKNKISNFFNFGLSFFILLFASLVLRQACLPFGQVLSFAQEEFVYDAKGRRNPFIPLVTPDGRLLKLEQEVSETGLSLEGVIYDANGISYAIVNGGVVKIGDIAGDNYQVLKIEQDKVIFIKEGQTTEEILKKEE